MSGLSQTLAAKRYEGLLCAFVEDRITGERGKATVLYVAVQIRQHHSF